MAALSVVNSIGMDGSGGTATVSFNYDSITFLVASISIVNNQASSYTWKVINTLSPLVTESGTVAANSTNTHILAISLTLNADLSLPISWSFGTGLF